MFSTTRMFSFIFNWLFGIFLSCNSHAIENKSNSLSMLNSSPFISINLELWKKNMIYTLKLLKWGSMYYLNIMISIDTVCWIESIKMACSSIMLKNSTTNGIVMIKCFLLIALSIYSCKLIGMIELFRIETSSLTKLPDIEYWYG